MADNEEGERTKSRGNEWEVVSLTASAYAAAPGPDGAESVHEEKNNNGNEAETSRALFMSGHFVFPPSEHENLPIAPDNVEGEKEAEHGSTGSFLEEEGLSEQKGEDKWNVKGLSMPDVLHNIYDDKGNDLPIHGQDFEEEADIHGLNASTEPSAKFSSFGGATSMGGSVYDESKLSSTLPHPSDSNLEPRDDPHSEESDDKDDDGELPPGGWWKRQIATLSAHAKETNTFWSIFIAATVMGLVILGKQWQQEERWRVLQQRWDLNLSAEHSRRMFGPLTRFKNMIVGQRTIKNTVSAER